MSPLKNQVAIVTGAGKGLGAATARLLASQGAHLVVNDIDQQAAASLAQELETDNKTTCLVSHHNIAHHAEAHELAQIVAEKFSKIDILVNNAGILRDATLLKLEESDWDAVIDVNLKGPFNMTQACASKMKEKKSGKILNLSSIAWFGNIGQSNYSAAKAGLVGLTRTCAIELARYNINVNAIAPGLIDTDMTRSIPEDIKSRMIKSIPLQRMGKPEEIAELIAFLISDRSSYITGQCIQIDGGLTTGIRLG